jgi:hypothetical protein
LPQPDAPQPDPVNTTIKPSDSGRLGRLNYLILSMIVTFFKNGGLLNDFGYKHTHSAQYYTPTLQDLSHNT